MLVSLINRHIHHREKNFITGKKSHTGSVTFAVTIHAEDEGNEINTFFGILHNAGAGVTPPCASLQLITFVGRGEIDLPDILDVLAYCTLNNRIQISILSNESGMKFAVKTENVVNNKHLAITA